MAESLEGATSCGLCFGCVAKYTCPKCAVNYCSLTCYKSEKHVSCSENFYKNCIEEELALHVKTSGNDRRLAKAKMEEILKKVAAEEEEQNSDDLSESDDDLEERLKNVDLDNADEVWEKLTDKERKEFQQLIESGKIAEIIPSNDPWWIKESVPLIEEVGKEKHPNIPNIKQNIPLLSSLMGKKPNDIVKYGLLNILYSYCCVIRLHQLDLDDDTNSQEWAESLLKISSCLSQGKVFQDAAEAVDYARAAACNEFQLSTETTFTIKKDIFVILKHKVFTLSALSHIHHILEQAQMKGRPKRETFLATKKIEFYLSYIYEYGDSQQSVII